MTDIRLVKTIKGKSKGYAYVEFKDEVITSLILAEVNDLIIKII